MSNPSFGFDVPEHSKDSRVKTVNLTKHGIKLAKKLVPIVEDIDAKFFNHLQTDDNAKLIELLQNLVQD